MQKFNIDINYLHKHLFAIQKPKYGPPTKLNVQYLPNFLYYIKNQLQEQEKLCLIDYQLQSFLIQLAIMHKDQTIDNHLNTIPSLKAYVLNQIRNHSKFWVGNSNIWKRIHYKGNVQVNNDQQKQKNLKAMMLYQSQTQNINKRSEYCKTGLKTFKLNRVRCLQQNYSFFQAYNINDIQQVFQRIDYNICILLRIYFLREYTNKDQSVVEKYILDMILCEEQRKRRKKYGVLQSQDFFENECFQKFHDFCAYQRQNLRNLIVDFKKQEIIIINIIKIYENINKKLNQQNQTQIAASNNFNQSKKKQIMNKIRTSIDDQIFTQSQIQQISIKWLTIYKSNQNKIQQLIAKNTLNFNNLENIGYISTQQQIQKAKIRWIQIQQAPQIQKLNKYKYHSQARIQWSPQQYKVFLEGLIIYLQFPVNNKKIANFIGKDIQPNHVKFVKGSYLRNLKKRMTNGQCGGGKRGECFSKKQFIERDLQNFSMKWFQRVKVNKTIKKRKRMIDSDSSDSSSEVY